LHLTSLNHLFGFFPLQSLPHLDLTLTLTLIAISQNIKIYVLLLESAQLS